MQAKRNVAVFARDRLVFFCYDWREVRSVEKTKQTHPISPLFDAHSRVLLLGSFPSVKSREAGFFYGHPQNRFWRVLADIFGEVPPETIEEKKSLALRRGVALWDVIAQCEIVGSSDASITNVAANDLSVILNAADIRAIFCNGNTSYTYYNKYCRAETLRDAVLLPSTSPANARWTREKLAQSWGAALLPYLHDER